MDFSSSEINMLLNFMICFALHVTLVSPESLQYAKRYGQTKRDSTEIWRASYVPQTTKVSDLLVPFQPLHSQWGDDSLAASTRHSSLPALSVFYQKGSYSQTSHKRGAGFYSTPSELDDNVDSLILMYDVYFEDFGWGNMGKLPGLFGGESGSGAYRCSGGDNPSTCFSLRLMWRDHGKGELYAYIPSNQASGFSKRPDVHYNAQFGHSIGRGKIHFREGEWQTILELVHLNTPGSHNGYVKMCVIYHDGSRQCYTASDLNMRNTGSHHLRGMFFSTFFGGSDKDDGAPNDCKTYFRNFRLKYPSSGPTVG